MLEKIIDTIAAAAALAVIAGSLIATVHAEGGTHEPQSRVGMSVDRSGLHVRVRVGNPQTSDVVIAGGVFRQRQDQINSPINGQGFHGAGLAGDHGAVQGGASPGGHGEY